MFVKIDFRKIPWKNDLSRGKTEVEKPAMRSLTHAPLHAPLRARPRRSASPRILFHFRGAPDRTARPASGRSGTLQWNAPDTMARCAVCPSAQPPAPPSTQYSPRVAPVDGASFGSSRSRSREEISCPDFFVFPRKYFRKSDTVGGNKWKAKWHVRSGNFRLCQTRSRSRSFMDRGRRNRPFMNTRRS